MAGLLDNVNALASDPRYSGLLNSANQTVSNPVNPFVTPVSASSGNAGNAFMASVQAIKDAAAKKLVDSAPKQDPFRLIRYSGIDAPGTGRDPEVGQYRRGNLPQQGYADGSMKYPVYKGPTERRKIQTGQGSFKYADVPTTGPFREVRSLSSPNVLKYPDFYGVTEQDYIDYFDRYGPDVEKIVGEQQDRNSLEQEYRKLQGAGPTGENPGMAISEMSGAQLMSALGKTSPFSNPLSASSLGLSAALSALGVPGLLGLAFSKATDQATAALRSEAAKKLTNAMAGDVRGAMTGPTLGIHPSMPYGIGVAPSDGSSGSSGVNRGGLGSFGHGTPR